LLAGRDPTIIRLDAEKMSRARPACTGDADLGSCRGTPSGMPPFDLTGLLVATCRFNAVALRRVQAIGLRQSGWHALRRYYRVSLLEFQQLAIK